MSWTRKTADPKRETLLDMANTTSPVRRVLGDKDKNASLKPRSPTSTKSTIRGSTTTPSRVRANPQHTTPYKKFGLTSSRAGYKRRFGETDLEEVEDRRGNFDRTSSEGTRAPSDTSSTGLPSHGPFSSLKTSKTTATTCFTSFTPSQGAEHPVEQHFDLRQDEMSQRTIDKLHAVVLPRDMIELPPHPSRALNTEMSSGSIGLSSFIDFSGHPSSQASNGSHVAEQPKSSRDGASASQYDSLLKESAAAALAAAALTKEVARKRMLDQKADELRTRLQLAMYKVQTKQTNRPFSRLRQPNAKSHSSPQNTYQPPRVFSSPEARQHSTPVSPDAHVAARRAEATAQSKPAVRPLDSLPVPKLLPTCIPTSLGQRSRPNAHHPSSDLSSGDTILVEPPLEVKKKERQPDPDETDDEVQLPSSPPLSRSNSAVGTSRHLGKPAKESGAARAPPPRSPLPKSQPLQLSSPPESDAENDDDDDINADVDVDVDEEDEDMIDFNETPKASAFGQNQQQPSPPPSFLPSLPPQLQSEPSQTGDRDERRDSQGDGAGAEVLKTPSHSQTAAATGEEVDTVLDTPTHLSPSPVKGEAASGLLQLMRSSSGLCGY